MRKTLKTISLILLSAIFLVCVADEADAKKKKKKIPKKPSYVGAVKCNGSCHDPYYNRPKFELLLCYSTIVANALPVTTSYICLT